MPGRWKVLPKDAEVLSVHAALLHTGEILYFGGNEFDTDNHNAWAEKGDFTRVNHTRLFNCRTHEIRDPGSPQTDLFCCGHAFLPDGRLLVAGGTEHNRIEMAGEPHWHHWPGVRDTATFDPLKETWTVEQPMAGGRWYPTLLTLADGGVLAVNGHPSDDDPLGRHNNNVPERFSPTQGSWTSYRPLGEAVGYNAARDPADWFIVYYPRMHVLGDGRVFCADPLYQPGHPFAEQSLIYDLDSGDAVPTGGPGTFGYTNFGNTGAQNTSVLLPFLAADGYRDRILMCGAKEAVIMDLGVQRPVWRPTTSRRLPEPNVRRHCNAVLLPTGEVMVCGGTTDGSDNNEQVRKAEFYRPRPGWVTLPPGGSDWSCDTEPATVARQYHSVALLMPDGRVWTAGSNRRGQPGIQNAELRIEVYEPWYVDRSRPVIEYAPQRATYQHAFEVAVRGDHAVSAVNIIRAGSCTHSFNADQRYVGLTFRRLGAGRLEVDGPPNGGVAPPGYYLLFVVDDDGVPSEGRFLRVGERLPVTLTVDELRRRYGPDLDVDDILVDPLALVLGGDIYVKLKSSDPPPLLQLGVEAIRARIDRLGPLEREEALARLQRLMTQLGSLRESLESRLS